MSEKTEMAIDRSQSLLLVLISLMGSSAIALSHRQAIAQAPNRAVSPNRAVTIYSAPPKIDPAFPESVKAAVLQAVATETRLQPDQFVLTQATPKIWSDGCLGLGPPAQMCTAVLVRGWEVRVMHRRQEWVYRTNSSGQAVQLDPAGSRLGQIIAPPADPIPTDQRPSALGKKAIFREIKSGGFAGISQEITLYKDGRLVQKGGSAAAEQVLRTLSKKEVKAFKKRLEKLHFGQFDGLRYPAPKGAADYFTETFANGQTTVQYADLNLEELPQDLQSAIQAWRSLTVP
jgi:hypothetical protein